MQKSVSSSMGASIGTFRKTTISAVNRHDSFCHGDDTYLYCFEKCSVPRSYGKTRLSLQTFGTKIPYHSNYPVPNAFCRLISRLCFNRSVNLGLRYHELAFQFVLTAATTSLIASSSMPNFRLSVGNSIRFMGRSLKISVVVGSHQHLYC